MLKYKLFSRPLLWNKEKNKCTEELEEILKELFQKYDLDKDGYWTKKEMDAYNTQIDGVGLSNAAFMMNCLSFGSNEAGNALSQKGYIQSIEFYLMNHDHSEVVNDLLCFYDEKTLFERLLN